VADRSPYAALLGAQVRSQTTYRLSFALDLVFSTLMMVIEAVAVLVMYTVNPSFGGFRLGQGLLIAGLATVAFSIGDAAVGNVEDMSRYIRSGLLDAVLLRPLGTLPQLMVLDFAPRRFGRVAWTVGVLAVGIAKSGIEWTPAKLALVIVAPLAGAVTFGSIFVVGATTQFWLIDTGQVAHAFTYGGREFTSYPSTVFGPAVRWLFAYGLGFASVAYLPALALLDRHDPAGLPDWARWCAPLTAALWALVATVFWRFGVRHYRSTGS
jgi:ABC-2 type transport system permease protein